MASDPRRTNRRRAQLVFSAVPPAAGHAPPQPHARPGVGWPCAPACDAASHRINFATRTPSRWPARAFRSTSSNANSATPISASRPETRKASTTAKSSRPSTRTTRANASRQRRTSLPVVAQPSTHDHGLTRTARESDQPSEASERLHRNSLPTPSWLQRVLEGEHHHREADGDARIAPALDADGPQGRRSLLDELLKAHRRPVPVAHAHYCAGPIPERVQCG
jgi:hypothetical protein